MHFESWTDFWHMGGYAFYVWLAFAITLGAMGLLVIESKVARNKLKGQVLAEAARKERIRQTKNKDSDSESHHKLKEEGQ